VFVSYHHGGDQAYYNAFSRVFHDALELITDTSLERARDSADPSYIMRCIREQHLYGSSCTIVLCGVATPFRKYVDWEIEASLTQGMGLLGLRLPTLPIINDGCSKPDRLQDNIESGFAVWNSYENVVKNPSVLPSLIETAVTRSSRLISNSRPRRLRNG
jgi:hypothetical protein